MAWQFTGITVRQVEPGTVIRCEETGTEETVDDTHAAALRGVMYVTPKFYERLRRQFAERHTAQEEPREEP